MDIKEIKQIVDLMKRYDLTKFEIEEEGFKLGIGRERKMPAAAVAATPPPFPAAPAANPAPIPDPAKEKEETGVFIKSPMVGTFYRAASPESPPYVEVGLTVEPETVVCIIEAMKVMNDIKAEVNGKILEVLVENGAAVEYGQPLFRIQ